MAIISIIILAIWAYIVYRIETKKAVKSNKKIRWIYPWHSSKYFVKRVGRASSHKHSTGNYHHSHYKGLTR